MEHSHTPPSRWEGIGIIVAAQWEEAVISFLVDEGIKGVEVREPKPLKTEIIAYMEPEQDADDFARQVQNYLDQLAEAQPDLGPGELNRFSIDSADWSEKWKESFKPIEVGNRLVIAPSWESYAVRAGESLITIDPGMAFGTGQHETTRLCLEALIDLTANPPSAWEGRDINLLDVGCGSGILSLAAVNLGAKGALAIDNDPLAVEIARENIEQNGLQDRIEARLQNIDDIQGEFRIITANIQLNILKAMAHGLKRLLARDGVLLLSGVLVDQQASLLESFPELAVRGSQLRGEWALVKLAWP